jgi:hypothetical protein
LPDITLEPVDLPVPAPEPATAPKPATAPASGAATTSAASPLRIQAQIEPASPDVVVPSSTAGLPGAHRGGFATPPTAPVELAQLVPVEAPREFVPTTGTATLPVATSASWNPGTYALLFAITGLTASFVVGWLFPLAIIGVVFAVIALRRPSQRRRGAWALALALLALIYSAGWLVYAAFQAGIL